MYSLGFMLSYSVRLYKGRVIRWRTGGFNFHMDEGKELI